MRGVKRFEDFDAWKLSSELRDLVYRMTSSGKAVRDGKFCDQIRNAAAGAPRNIAEGFGRFNPTDFSNYTRYAKASLEETKNHLLHGKQEKYFSDEDFDAALRLYKRSIGATKGLHRYLLSCKGRLPWDTTSPNGTRNQNLNPRNPGEPKEPTAKTS